jgi:hypothetical protein
MNLLQENGGALLQENGFYLLLDYFVKEIKAGFRYKIF